MSDPTTTAFRFRRRRARTIALFIVLAAGSSVAVWGRSAQLKRFAVVEEGVLYRSAQPTVGQLERLAERPGIKTLLIVREGGGDRMNAEVKFAKEHGLNVVHIPIQSQTRIPEEAIPGFWKCVDDPAMRPILIHCSAGRHRTGFLCALYRIERQGWTVERAMNEMHSFGFDTDAHVMILEQLKSYRSQVRRDAMAPSVAATRPSAKEGA